MSLADRTMTNLVILTKHYQGLDEYSYAPFLVMQYVVNEVVRVVLKFPIFRFYNK